MTSYYHGAKLWNSIDTNNKDCKTIIECMKMQNADWSSLYVRFNVCLKMLIYITRHIYVIMLCILICNSMLFIKIFATFFMFIYKKDYL